MRFEITHRTRYTYSLPVLLDPHSLHLRPRGDSAQRICDFDLQVTPVPAGRAEYVDLEGNSVIRVWFCEAASSLCLVSRSCIETTRSDPFDFLLQAAATSLPIRWRPREERQLATYRMRRQPSRLVDDLAGQVLDEVGSVTTLFLTTLARRIADTCRPLSRPQGEPNAPSVTLIRRSGAARDLAVLFMDGARAAGLPARYASGYVADATRGKPELHAWAEVFLPGAGWRGFDPSLGLAVADQHVVLAAAADPRDAATVEGAFLGNDVEATLDAAIDVQIPPEVAQLAAVKRSA